MESFPEISKAYLETKYGQIFYRCCGFYGDPLILIIHGSGPNNSSREYEFFQFEYIAKICFIRRFFIVAIDCPGYGNSSGSKQTVRSYPLELIEEIFRALNYVKAFALFGHSQGGSSIFNAVFQKNTITDILLMDRPVCGDIKRFANFPVPCLLVYDIEDDGHPIAQGRLLNKYLKFSRLLTYKSSKDPYWITDYLWESVLEFLRKYEEGLAKRSRSLNQRKKSECLIPSEAYQYKYDEFSTFSNNFNIRSHLSEEKYTKKTEFDSRILKNLIIKDNTHTENLKNNEIILKKPQISEKDKNPKEKQKTKEIPLPKPEMEEEKKEAHFLKTLETSTHKTPKNPEKNGKNEKDLQDNNYLCSLCLDIYYKPIKLDCDHNFCLICLNDLAFYETRCPLCRKEFPEKFDKSEKNLNEKLISEMKINLSEKRLEERAEKALKEQQKQGKKILFMGFGYEYKEIVTKPRMGNAPVTKKYDWKIYVKQLNFAKQNMIKSVEFDINVGIIGSKPIKVEKSPFILEGKGGYCFSPNIKVFWTPNLKMQAYETNLRVDFSERNRMKKFMIKLN